MDKTKKITVYWKTNTDPGYNFEKIIVPANVSKRELNHISRRTAIDSAGLEFGYSEVSE
ncbi:hypothetical protein [Lactobacillus sp. ESL0681]|uniref:hypothetical protein n=1 Tax=Lactobacillus sp. ESL0681 TaxID=2983211 RepID=UPI0023F6512A|nr:hypothetical protein [Lactobacillus sp. ESL0681]WEV41302.1 hypothetical protein OZX59_09235 [Lactobacillus sp. ESL0681]